MAAFLSEQDLKNLGAVPLFGQNEVGGSAGNIGRTDVIRGGEGLNAEESASLYTDAQGQQHYLRSGGGVRPIEQIQYKLPSGQIFQYRSPGANIGYSSSGSFEQISGSPFGGGSTETPEQLIASGQYRDVPANILRDYQSGKLSSADAVAAIKGSPVFNPAIGPQADYGRGQLPFLSNVSGANASTIGGQQKQQGQGPYGNIFPISDLPPDQQKALQNLKAGISAQETPQQGQGVPPPQNSLNAIPGESYAQYEARLGFPQGGASTDLTNPNFNAAANLGLPNNISDMPLNDIISKVSATFGLTNVTDELKKVDNKFAEDVTTVNENPWLSEGLRSKQIAALTQKYDLKKDQLVNRLRLQESVVGKAIDIYYKEKEFKKQLLFKELDIKSRQLQNQARQNRFDITQEGIESRFERGQAAAEDRFQRLHGAGSGGQILNNLLASKGQDGFIDPQAYLKERLGAKITPRDFDERYSSLLNPRDKISMGISLRSDFNTRLQRGISAALIKPDQRDNVLKQIIKEYPEHAQQIKDAFNLLSTVE